MRDNLFEPLNLFNAASYGVGHDGLNGSQTNADGCPPHRGPSTPLQVRRIDGSLRHSPPCLLRQTHSHPKILRCISPRADFFPRTRRSKQKLESSTFSPHLIPSLTMNCQPLSQPGPPRNQILLYLALKPRASNRSHFIRPLLSHEICSVASKRGANWAPETVGANIPCPWGTAIVWCLRWHRKARGICWDRSCRIGDIHTNAIQMEG